MNFGVRTARVFGLIEHLPYHPPLQQYTLGRHFYELIWHVNVVKSPKSIRFT